MAGPLGVPLEQVRTMKAQGYENSQIIQSLQRDGYTSAQIADALNQLELKPGIEADEPQTDRGLFASEPQTMQHSAQQAPPAEELSAPSPAADFQEHVSMQTSDYGGGETEELIEAIIDEKWNDLVKDINKIIDWKNSTESKIAALEQQLNDLKQQFERLHHGVLGKVGEYDRNIQSVGAELKAMEKVFSKVLPQFTENVNELSRLANKMK